MEPLEKQYLSHFQELKDLGPVELGPMSSATWRSDPKRLAMTLSRYKFVSKMLAGLDEVIEIGCGDGWASEIVRKEVGRLTLSDMDPIWAKSLHSTSSETINFIQLDLSESVTEKKYHAAYALDVLEHVDPHKSEKFCRNLSEIIRDSGVAIIGIPSIESQPYASEGSRIGHVNCMSGEQLKLLLNKCFNNVFIFSMNDEVVHT